MSKESNAATSGFTMGAALAMILSFQCNHSVLWAVLHGCLSWVYVVYRVIVGGY